MPKTNHYLLLRERTEVTCGDNILTMEFRGSTKCIFQDPSCRCEGQVLLNEAEEMIGKVLENEHGLLGDGVIDEVDIVNATA
jgi:hypothetical protein